MKAEFLRDVDLLLKIRHKKCCVYTQAFTKVNINYGGPQVHTEFQKVTPNSNNSHRIQISHTEFK